MDFGDYVRLVRRSAVLIVLLLLLGILAGAGITAVQQPTYQATATAYVTADAAGDISDLSLGGQFAQQSVTTFADIATTAYVLNEVITTLGLKDTPQQLARRISVAVPTNETVLTITATAPTAKEAAAIANTDAAQLNTAVQDLVHDTGTRQATIRITLVSPAVAPATPISPKPLSNIALGGLVGLIVALLIAVLRQLLDTRIRSLVDIERLTSRPILGVLTRDDEPKRRVGSMREFAANPGAEAFRTLRTNLRFLDGPGVSRSFVLTSPGADQVKSVVAANLAIAIADLGARVLVVDADLRRPRLAAALGLSDGWGLADVLAGRAALSESIQQWPDRELHVLPAGTLPGSPNELLQSVAMVNLVARLERDYDTVIFDTPPLLVASDGAIVARYVQGALIVCGIGQTRRAEFASALGSLQRVGAPLLGVVATGLRGAGRTRYGRRRPRVAAADVRQKAGSRDGDAGPLAT